MDRLPRRKGTPWSRHEGRGLATLHGTKELERWSELGSDQAQNELEMNVGHGLDVRSMHTREARKGIDMVEGSNELARWSVESREGKASVFMTLSSKLQGE